MASVISKECGGRTRYRIQFRDATSGGAASVCLDSIGGRPRRFVPANDAASPELESDRGATYERALRFAALAACACSFAASKADRAAATRASACARLRGSNTCDCSGEMASNT